MTAGQVSFWAGMMRPGSAMDMVVDLMMGRMVIRDREVNVSGVTGCRTYVWSCGVPAEFGRLPGRVPVLVIGLV